MALSETIAKFETLMRIYVDEHCIATNGAQCVKPDLRFGIPSGGDYDIPTDEPGQGHHTPAPSPVHSGNPCDGVVCRGNSQVCNEETGVCERPDPRDSDGFGSGSGSGSCPTECCDDVECRGPKVCTDGVCVREAKDSSDRGFQGGGGGGGSGRGGGRGGILEEQVIESMESIEEEMEFDSAFTAKTENENGFRFSLQNATVNVSTVMALLVMAMMVLMARCCFWKTYGDKVAKKGVAVNYGTVTGIRTDGVTVTV